MSDRFTVPVMSLRKLPPELILCVGGFVQSGKDLSSLMRTCKQYLGLLEKYHWERFGEVTDMFAIVDKGFLNKAEIIVCGRKPGDFRAAYSQALFILIGKSGKQYQKILALLIEEGARLDVHLDEKYLAAFLKLGNCMKAVHKEALTPLHAAISLRDEAYATQLLKKWRHICCFDHHRQSPLHLAVMNGYPRLVESILLQPIPSGGCTCFYWDFNGDIPLHKAARPERTDIMEILLKGGCPVNVGNSRDETPLHSAVRNSSAAACQLLLNYGADIDAITKQEHTPLLESGFRRNHQVLRLLLENGAGVRGTERRYSPQTLAAACGNAIVIQLLHQYGIG